MIVAIRDCKWCNKTIEVKSGRPDQRFCNSRCSTAHRASTLGSTQGRPPTQCADCQIIKHTAPAETCYACPIHVAWKSAKRLSRAYFYKDITFQQAREILSIGRCFYCGSTYYLTLDHVVPVSRGGLTTVANLVPACRRCNSRKSAKPITDIIVQLDFLDFVSVARIQSPVR